MLDAFGQPQSVVVLGGTSEIAAHVVDRLVARRCRTVVLAGRDQGRLAAGAAAAEAAGADRVDTVVGDARDPGDAARVVDDCFAAAGEVDLIVVAVGILPHDGDEMDPAKTAETVTVSYTWPAAALARAATLLISQGHGRIMVLSSAGAIRIRRANFLYGSAKAGLDGFSLGMGRALEGTGVTVQVVRPAFVHTKMTAGRKATPLATGPAEVAEQVMAGLASGAPIVWSPPAMRWIAPVLRAMPGPLWRRLPG